MQFHPVCTLETMEMDSLREFEVAGTRILLFRLEDGFHATQARCTHLFGSLKNGRLREGRIECPLHRAEFDVRSGAVLRWANFPPGIQLANWLRPGKALKTYPVRVENGQVAVAVDA